MSVIFIKMEESTEEEKDNDGIEECEDVKEVEVEYIPVSYEESLLETILHFPEGNVLRFPRDGVPGKSSSQAEQHAEELTQIPYTHINGIQEELEPVSQSQNSNLESASTCSNTACVRRSRGGRKRKIPHNRVERKKFLNSNKDTYNYRGAPVPAREFQNYVCNCPMKCSDRVTEEERRTIFEKFWALGNYDSQVMFLASTIVEGKVKRKRNKLSTKRTFTRSYFFGTVQVCREMYVRTLRISSKRINTALKKHRCPSLSDERGQFSGGSVALVSKDTYKNRGTPVLAKEFRNYVCNCPRKCSDKVPEEERRTIFETFWSLGNRDSQAMFLASTVVEKKVKRKRNALSPKRTFTRSYFFGTVRVCRTIYIRTLQISYRRIDTALKKRPSPSPSDKRGQVRGGRNALASKNTRGTPVRAREFRNCICYCPMKCSDEVSEEERRRIFEKFWALGNYDSQSMYLASTVVEEKAKRKRNGLSTKRTCTRSYFFGTIQVCRTIYIQTLQISHKRIDIALKKHRSPSLSDKRGQFTGGHNALAQSSVRIIRNHIQSFPKYISHCTREESTRQYLAPNLSIDKMHELFKKRYPQISVSVTTYRNVFVKYFNLTRKKLPKDTCQICDTFSVRLSQLPEGDEKNKVKAEHNEHVLKAEKAKEMMRRDLQIAREDPDTETLAYNLQKALPLPRIPTEMLYYKRQLMFLNLGITSGQMKRSYSYSWVESTAGRGAQEVGSCIMKHVKEKCSHVKKLILWSDSCGGLNRNIRNTLLMKAVMEECPNIESIVFRFLYSGHSILGNDSDFGDIESALKIAPRLYTDEDCREVISACRKKNPIVVVKMEKDDFVGTELIENFIINRNVTVEEEKVSWLNSRQVSVTRSEPFKVFMIHDFCEGAKVHEVDIFNEAVGGPSNDDSFYARLIQPLWPQGKPISAPKKKDLLNIQHLIPYDARSFYVKILAETPVNEELKDDIDSFNVIQLDFEVDDYTPEIDDPCEN